MAEGFRDPLLDDSDDDAPIQGGGAAPAVVPLDGPVIQPAVLDALPDINPLDKGNGRSVLQRTEMVGDDVVVTHADCYLYAVRHSILRQPITGGDITEPVNRLINLGALLLENPGMSSDAAKELQIKDENGKKVLADRMGPVLARQNTTEKYLAFANSVIDDHAKLRKVFALDIHINVSTGAPGEPKLYGKLLEEHVPGLYVYLSLYKTLSKLQTDLQDKRANQPVNPLAVHDLIEGASSAVANTLPFDLGSQTLVNAYAANTLTHCLEVLRNYQIHVTTEQYAADNKPSIFSPIAERLLNCLTSRGIIGQLVANRQEHGVFETRQAMYAACLAASESNFLAPQVRLVQSMIAQREGESLESMATVTLFANLACGYDILKVLASPMENKNIRILKDRLNPASTGVMCMMLLATLTSNTDITWGDLLGSPESRKVNRAQRSLYPFAQTVPFFRALYRQGVARNGLDGVCKITNAMIAEVFLECWSATVRSVGPTTPGQTLSELNSELVNVLFSGAISSAPWAVEPQLLTIGAIDAE